MAQQITLHSTTVINALKTTLGTSVETATIPLKIESDPFFYFAEAKSSPNLPLVIIDPEGGFPRVDYDSNPRWAIQTYECYVYYVEGLANVTNEGSYVQSRRRCEILAQRVANAPNLGLGASEPLVSANGDFVQYTRVASVEPRNPLQTQFKADGQGKLCPRFKVEVEIWSPMPPPSA